MTIHKNDILSNSNRSKCFRGHFDLIGDILIRRDILFQRSKCHLTYKMYHSNGVKGNIVVSSFASKLYKKLNKEN